MEIKTIIKQIFKDQQLDQIQEVEEKIKQQLGKSFFNKHIKRMFLHKNKVIIETNTNEAKTELNLFKTTIKPKIEISIK